MSGIVSAIIGAGFLLLVVTLLNPKWRAKLKIKTPSLGGLGGSLPWKRYFVWALIEALAITLICIYWSISLQNLKVWSMHYWLPLVLGHLLLLVFLSQKGGLGSHGGAGFSFKALVIIAFVGLLWYISYQWSSHSVRSDEVALEMARRATPPESQPGIQPETWEEIVPPNSYSKWTIWYSGFNTEGKLSAPARYLKGRLVGKEVVVYDSPLKWDYPGVPLGMAYGEAIRYFNEGTSPLVIKWSRTFK